MEDTLAMIASLQNQTYLQWELIVVDNASKVNPTDAITAVLPQAQVIRCETNLGFAGGNNAALAMAKGEFYFYVNNDTILTNNCLEVLVSTILSLDNPGALSPKFHFYYNKGTIEFAGCSNINAFTARNTALLHNQVDTGTDGVIATYYTHGAGMMIPKKVLEDVGPMHEDYFLYYEEMDWCERIRKAGYKIYCQRNALMYHKESATVGKLNPLKTFYLNRNRILFMNRNYPFPKNIPFLLFLVFVSIPKNLISYTLGNQKAHLKAYVKALMWHLNPNIKF